MSTVQQVSLINVSNVKKTCRQNGNYEIHLPKEKEENPQKNRVLFSSLATFEIYTNI